VTLFAITLNREGVFTFVVAGPAGFSGFHLSHRCLQRTRLVWKYFRMAIGALVTLQMEFMAERSLPTFIFEGDFTRFQAFVALAAIAVCGKCILPVMTDSAGFALGHVFHGRLAGNGAVGECFCVTVGTLVSLEME